MNREEIQKWIRLVEESEISELEICEGRRKIRIAKHPSVAASAAAPFPQAVPTQIPANDDASEAEAPQLASNLKEIKSPMVGTFYRAPAPDAR